ncbi:protein RER1A-like [Silene latifolia]|uniref:protein RER1A-like n=1 Tax=Silene latifolia TaxID=37657 RepID=UPI003D781281
MVAKMQVWGHPWLVGGQITMKPHVNEETKVISSPITYRYQTDYNINNNNNSMLSSGSGLGLVRVWNQIRAERKSKYVERTEKDYSVKGESNQVFRWCLTSVIVVAHAVRILYYDPGYYLLTYVSGCVCFRDLIFYLSLDTLSVWEASDWARIVHLTPDHQLIRHEPCINEFFRHKLSPDQFDSLVRRLYEFKFWYRTTRTMLFTFVLTWFPFLKCSRVGAGVLLYGIVVHGCELVYEGTAAHQM